LTSGANNTWKSPKPSDAFQGSENILWLAADSSAHWIQGPMKVNLAAPASLDLAHSRGLLDSRKI
jgi:hypothetical protein